MDRKKNARNNETISFPFLSTLVLWRKKEYFVIKSEAIQRLVFHASHPNCLNSFSEVSISEWLNLTQINKLECRLHSEKIFIFSILSMRQSRYPFTYHINKFNEDSLDNIQTIHGTSFGNLRLMFTPPYYCCEISTGPSQINLARWLLEIKLPLSLVVNQYWSSHLIIRKLKVLSFILP